MALIVQLALRILVTFIYHLSEIDLKLTRRKQRMEAQASNARKTKPMQAIIQDAMAVIPSVFGETLVMELKILVSTRKRVTSSAIRPGTTSGGIRKLTQDTTTKSPLGKQQIYKYLKKRGRGGGGLGKSYSRFFLMYGSNDQHLCQQSR